MRIKLIIIGFCILLLPCFWIVTGNYNTQYGFVINEEAAVNIYESVLRKQFGIDEDMLMLFKPYRVKLLFCMWQMKRARSSKVLGGYCDTYILAIGGVVLWTVHAK